MEFIHTATLLHDDVVDGSETRRGKDTANIVFGNPATVLVGDFLFARAFELMVEDGSLKVLKILSSASAIIAQGEVDQLTAQRRIETSEERYLHIIARQTAALFAAASRIAAVVAECGEAEEQAWTTMAEPWVRLQLVDDCDRLRHGSATWARIAATFREGKMTLPVILRSRAGYQERRFWQDAIAGFRPRTRTSTTRPTDTAPSRSPRRANAIAISPRGRDALSIFPTAAPARPWSKPRASPSAAATDRFPFAKRVQVGRPRFRVA